MRFKIFHEYIFVLITIAFSISISVSSFAQCSTWSFNPPLVICNNSGAFALTGGSPAQGIYIGNGVVGNSFKPILAGVGNHRIGYKANACTDTAFRYFTVYPKPVLSLTSSPLPTPNPPPDPANIMVVSLGDTVTVNYTAVPAIFYLSSITTLDFMQLGYDYLFFPSVDRLYHLIAFANNGCIDTGSVDIRIKPCQALFSKSQALDSNNNPIPGNVVITDLSFGNPMTYLWDFGDGGTSTLQSPSHTYTGNGPYNLCLTITNGSCSDTYCDSVSVDSNGIVMKQGPGFTLHVGNYNPSASILANSNTMNTIRVYPNPSSDILYIDSEYKIRSVRLYDSKGQFVLEKRLSYERQLNISELGKGWYNGSVQFENFGAEKFIPGLIRFLVQ